MWNLKLTAMLLAGFVSATPPALAADSGAVTVEIAKQGDGYVLLRGGEPYEVKGAGLEFGNIAVLAGQGGNSFRTWRTDNGQSTGQEILDEAARHGVTVAMCIEIGRERHGFDYDDEETVARQLEYARGEVLKYKDHPALLAWIIGNEMNLHFKNPRVFDAINEISQMIHEVDGHHPTTTALAGIDANLVGHIEKRAPDLDFISIQMYGDIVNLPRYIKQIGLDAPYMVTEWGAVGHWEVGETKWGAPIEQNSSQKAANYLKSHEVAIASNPDQIIGSYVFLWGQKQERTPTWYGMFLEDGSRTEAVDMMYYIWNGNWPENRSPQIKELQLDGRTAHQNVKLERGGKYDAVVGASDPDGDTLTYDWSVMRESEATQTGGDQEDVPEILSATKAGARPGDAVLTAPDEPGNYRLFVYVRDGKGNAGHANIPFRVLK